MIECPRCGTGNAANARFCNNCGASLVARVAVKERRVVTALFADLARSTSLGERLDPEVVRGMVGEFFELARREIEARGGTVEKFSGDAVMAVFGLPSAHEDDPERAIRAAVAVRDGVTALAVETQARHGVALQARIGIESGDVVVGDPFGGATMATGDAMNLAARLEQQAEPGEIVVGRDAWEHVRDLVRAEPLGELAIRGHSAGIQGWRVHEIARDVGRPRGVPGLEAPLTGRDEELALLLDAGRRAARERKAVLFTILGVPGVGKSRLVREATSRLAADGWSVVRGRCLPYGEGITYWPIAEMVRSLSGIDAETSPDDASRRLQQASPDADVADRLGLVLGVRDVSAVVSGVEQEIAWAFRRLIEHVCQVAPHVLVFEDIHWAEPPLLDLIEYVATWARDIPLVLICPSRPELLDRRPGWGAGRMEASRISLEPLSEQESRTLLGALLTVEELPAQLRQRVLDRAEGNPLFVEEVVRMLIEEGVVERRGDRWVARREASEVRVPDSVEALIRARLDTLPAPERAVLQTASVVGRVFQRSAVAALASGTDGTEGTGGADAPDAAGGPGARPATPGLLDRHLEEAVLRDMITEERSPDQERTFRFRHVLIRDVAYGTLPKARRARLHLGVADWLREWAGPRLGEFVELEAYHLEQAARVQRELEGKADPAALDRALDALVASARAALGRDDARAAKGFADRALDLEPADDERRLELEWIRVEALRRLGHWREAAQLATPVEERAGQIGRLDLQGRAVFARAGDIWIAVGSADAPRALSELRRARELLLAAHDDQYLCHVLEFLGYGGWWVGNMAEAELHWSEEREIARAQGWHSREAEAVTRLAGIAGQRGSVEERRRLLETAAELAERGTSRLTRARVKRAFGGFLATSISGADAEAPLRESAAVLEELGDQEEAYVVHMYLGEIERRRGRPKEALRFFERARDHAAQHAGYLPEAERRIAEALLDLGRVAEAADHAERAIAVAGHDDWATVASTRMALGLVREAQGRTDEAERLLRDAVDVVHRTEFNPWDDELALAEFLLRARRTDEGRDWLSRARSSAERYGPQSPLIAYVEERGRAAEERASGSRDREVTPPASD